MRFSCRRHLCGCRVGHDQSPHIRAVVPHVMPSFPHRSCTALSLIGSSRSWKWLAHTADTLCRQLCVACHELHLEPRLSAFATWMVLAGLMPYHSMPCQVAPGSELDDCMVMCGEKVRSSTALVSQHQELRHALSCAATCQLWHQAVPYSSFVTRTKLSQV